MHYVEVTMAAEDAPDLRTLQKLSPHKINKLNIKSLSHNYVLGYKRYILVVVVWIENKPYPKLFNPVNSSEDGTMNSYPAPFT